jgi:hypothetical protein
MEEVLPSSYHPRTVYDPQSGRITYPVIRCRVVKGENPGGSFGRDAVAVERITHRPVR